MGSSVSKEQLSDRLDRKEIVRGTALTITGGFLWGLAEYLANIRLNTKE